jgi:hypothetical protein
MSNLPSIILPTSILPKHEIEERMRDVHTILLADNDAITAYVYAKQFEAAAAVLVKSLQGPAELAFNGQIKIGAAKVEMVGGKPKQVITYPDDVKAAIRDQENSIAISLALIEQLKAQALEDGKATVSAEEYTRTGLKVTFDK